MKRDIYVAIMRAAECGEGLRLSADECYELSFDDAIATRATNVLEDSECGLPWSKINPRKKRVSVEMADIFDETRPPATIVADTVLVRSIHDIPEDEFNAMLKRARGK